MTFQKNNVNYDIFLFTQILHDHTYSNSNEGELPLYYKLWLAQYIKALQSSASFLIICVCVCVLWGKDTRSLLLYFSLVMMGGEFFWLKKIIKYKTAV